jgi:hypothetical protein
VRTDWREIRNWLNPYIWWSAYFGKESYVAYICGELVRLDSAPGRGFLASNDEYAKVAANVDALWEQVADRDSYPGHVEGFVAEYVREMDAQHKEPSAAWALLVSRLPAANIADPDHLDTIIRSHRYNA